MSNYRWVLPVIVVSQFCCTSLWFAGNGVMNNLVVDFQLDQSALGYLTSAVQFGFIAGTLIFALLTVADRFAPAKVFFLSALFAAMFNLGIILEDNSFNSLLFLRFGTGFFLAGIYPVGMKIAADYYAKGLGKSLGFLVGALVVGTAFPHLLRGLTNAWPWSTVLITTSVLATLGGGAMWMLVPNGPYRMAAQKLDLRALYAVFRNKEFRAAAFGYFGHMWELYAFWAFVPLILGTYTSLHPGAVLNIPVVSFCVIGVGGLACIAGGYLSQKFGEKNVAALALFASGLCCIVSPFVFQTTSTTLFMGFLLFWGMMVVADSPLFSTLVAQNTAPESKGTALTIVNCIGFSITIASIQTLSVLMDVMDLKALFVLLGLGPVLGLIALFYRNKSPEVGATG